MSSRARRVTLATFIQFFICVNSYSFIEVNTFLSSIYTKINFISQKKSSVTIFTNLLTFTRINRQTMAPFDFHWHEKYFHCYPSFYLIC